MTISRIQPDTTLPKTPAAKQYIAIANQSSTDPPTITILKNTLGTIVWTYNNPGEYIGTLAGAFPALKTICQIPQSIDANSNGVYTLYRSSNNTVVLKTGDILGNACTLDDGWLINIGFTISVYN